MKVRVCYGRFGQSYVCCECGFELQAHEGNLIHPVRNMDPAWWPLPGKPKIKCSQAGKIVIDPGPEILELKESCEQQEPKSGYK